MNSLLPQGIVGAFPHEDRTTGNVILLDANHGPFSVVRRWRFVDTLSLSAAMFSWTATRISAWLCLDSVIIVCRLTSVLFL